MLAIVHVNEQQQDRLYQHSLDTPEASRPALDILDLALSIQNIPASPGLSEVYNMNTCVFFATFLTVSPSAHTEQQP